ncbi:hypothetical protein CW740_06265 [Kangiella profundi]|uniref:Uncharacterized protein n=1 Tax=Kangiella profundi TaxID=1561924 RepID=A0A2K9AUQ2_9GAMM|nr:hypothetical protein [Kangiella profundi]AUD78871.1 hypothetical protein CW740_06265 [Kangiella profundi]GGF03404.1 hypothetical protein GCM10011356_16400 [Kangiella profundi]
MDVWVPTISVVVGYFLYAAIEFIKSKLVSNQIDNDKKREYYEKLYLEYKEILLNFIVDSEELIREIMIIRSRIKGGAEVNFDKATDYYLNGYRSLNNLQLLINNLALVESANSYYTVLTNAYMKLRRNETKILEKENDLFSKFQIQVREYLNDLRKKGFGLDEHEL